MTQEEIDRLDIEAAEKAKKDKTTNFEDVKKELNIDA